MPARHVPPRPVARSPGRACACAALAFALSLALALTGCTTAVPAPLGGRGDAADAGEISRRVEALLPADVLLLGEQHDAPDHHGIERRAVETLAARTQLAALAIEMAEEGHDTTALETSAAASATEAQVRAALHWDDKAWPWSDYGPAVMAAVRAGVPVVGANLPRSRMKTAMADVSLDAQLGDSARRAQEEAVRSGHCGLLPETQIAPMTRIQVARDRAMAQAVVKALQPGKTVLLIAGAGHTDKSLGVPQHLPSDLKAKSVRLLAAVAPTAADVAESHDATWRTPPLPEKDYCAGVRPAG